MSTIVYGDLSLEIGEDVGHRLDRATLNVSPPSFLPRASRAAMSLPDVLGRSEQLSDARDAIMAQRPIEVYASCGYGKSTLLRYVAAVWNRAHLTFSFGSAMTARTTLFSVSSRPCIRPTGQ